MGLHPHQCTPTLCWSIYSSIGPDYSVSIQEVWRPVLCTMNSINSQAHFNMLIYLRYGAMPPLSAVSPQVATSLPLQSRVCVRACSGSGLTSLWYLWCCYKGFQLLNSTSGRLADNPHRYYPPTGGIPYARRIINPT